MTGIEIGLGALALGSGLMGAVSSIQAGQTAKTAADYNAQVERIQAGQADATGAAQQARIEDENRRRIATATNAAAGTGTQVSDGTNVDLMADLARQGAMDAEITRWSARNKAGAALDQAQIDTYSGNVAQQAGYMRAAGSILNAASSYAATRYGRRSGAVGDL